MIPRSLEARLTLQQQALASLVIVVFAFSALWLTRTALYRQETRTLEATAQRLATDLDLELAEEGELARAADSLMVEESNQGIGILIQDAAGRRLAGSPTPMRRAQRLAASPPVIHRERARANCGAWVEVSVTDHSRRTAIEALARALTIAAVPLLLLTFMLGRWTVRSALRPLEDMTHRAGAISLEAGALTLGGAGGLVEVDRLRTAFDRLLGRLDEQLRAERQFASDASHELRTPLTVLSGEMEMALADPGHSPDTRAGLARAAEQVRTMRELVEALLLIRRAGEGGSESRRAFEPVDLSDVVTAARRDTERHYPGRDADLAVSTEMDVIVSGHPVLLAAGLRNLLDNAFKFTRPGIPVRVAVTAHAESAFVVVEDGGDGVPESELERVFDPFFRGSEARAAQAGFGLGLPILRRVARAHGGDVTMDRSPLGGARITLRLPRWRAESGRSGAVRNALG